MTRKCLGLLLFLPLASLAQSPAPAAKAEIDHLFVFIGHSDCRFNRNGAWHGMDVARSHMGNKLNYLVQQGRIDSAEAFIEGAGSRSSVSGKDYLVQCPGAAAVPSGAWLRTELQRYRKSRG